MGVNEISSWMWPMSERGTAPFRARRPRTRVSCWIVTMRSFWHNQIQRLVLFSAYERVCGGYGSWELIFLAKLPPARVSLPFFIKSRCGDWEGVKRKKAIFSRIHWFQHTSYADTVWKWLWGDAPCARDDKQLISLWPDILSQGSPLAT